MPPANSRQEKVEEILGMLASRATGGAPSNIAYRELRDELGLDRGGGVSHPMLAREGHAKPA